MDLRKPTPSTRHGGARSGRALWSTALVGMTLSAWIAAGPQVRQVDESALKNAGKTGEEWLTYGLNQAETRFSPLNQITTSNVKRAGLAWTYDLGSGSGA